MYTVFYLFVAVLMMHPSTGQVGFQVAKVEPSYKTEAECEKAAQRASERLMMAGIGPAITHCEQEMPGKDT